jgi:predicted nucleic acid-binding protein
MLVVSDTSPICYLILIDLINVLPQIYSQILIPEVVRDELADQDAPVIVQQWIRHLPTWAIVSTTQQKPDGNLLELDPGERAAILLAEDLGADLVLMDERKGRRIARSRGLNVTGLLGILDAAAARELIDLPRAIAQLQSTDFWVSPQLIDALLQKYDG